MPPLDDDYVTPPHSATGYTQLTVRGRFVDLNAGQSQFTQKRVIADDAYAM